MNEKAVLQTHRRAHREYLAGEAPGKKMHVKKPIERPDQGLKQTDVVAFNHISEPAFVGFLTDLIQTEHGVISYREAVKEVAFELNVSIDTAKRYLEKHSARRAEFSIADGYVRLREVAHDH